MRWYADNSELNGIRGAIIPDVIMFGGVAVKPEHEFSLRRAIERAKGKWGAERAPVKWNFKDLEKLYADRGLTKLHKDMLATSKDWRLEIAKAASAFEFRIIVAVVEAHSVAKRTLKGVKPNLSGYAFSNGLMRFALYAKEEGPPSVQVILDWPDKKDPKPFDSEYRAAFAEGKTAERKVSYHSGPLSSLNFYDCPAYVSMQHCTLLQFADLVLGANRELVECALGKKSTGFGVDFCKELRENYHGYPTNIVGHGMSVSSRRSAFRACVKDYVDREVAI